jgi:hypothetical protein
MDQLDDYKNIHRQRYLERENQRKIEQDEIKKQLEEERKKIEEEQKKQEKERKKQEEALNQLSIYCNHIMVSDKLADIDRLLTKLHAFLKKSKINHPSLTSRGMDLLESVNANPNIHINLMDQREVKLSNKMKETLKSVLALMGVDAQDMNLEYEMDCTNDEDIARRLENSFI